MQKVVSYAKAGWAWYAALIAAHPTIVSILIIVLALLAIR